MTPDQQLSTHFRLVEFIRSDAARRMGNPNLPTVVHLGNLKRVAACLEDARAILGNRSIRIMSGYRCPVVNKAVGGTRTSAHALGLAVDIVTSDLSPVEMAHALRDGGLVVDQAIVEADRGVLHLSFDPRCRMQWGFQHGGPGTPITWRLPLA